MFAKKALAIAVAVVGLNAGLAHADLVANGGFETGNFSGWTQGGNTNFTGVDGTNVHSGSFSAYLGPIGSDGTLSQSLATISGANYQLTFWLFSDGGRPNDFSANVGGNTLLSLAYVPGTEAWRQYTFDFVAAGNDTLAFSFRNDPGYLRLDDVSVAQVPEPAILALLGLGFAGIGFSRRKKA